MNRTNKITGAMGAIVCILAAVVLCGCVSLKGYRSVKSRMLYLEYERVNGPIQMADTVKIATEQEEQE